MVPWSLASNLEIALQSHHFSTQQIEILFKADAGYCFYKKFPLNALMGKYKHNGQDSALKNKLLDAL